EALERTPGTLVVWRPVDPMMIAALKFPKIEAAVRRWFRPCERFGSIEVWLRSDETGGGSCRRPGGERAGRGSPGIRSDPPATLAPRPDRRSPRAAIPPPGRATHPIHHRSHGGFLDPPPTGCAHRTRARDPLTSP